jgi:hypothetical protein
MSDRINSLNYINLFKTLRRNTECTVSTNHLVFTELFQEIFTAKNDDSLRCIIVNVIV